VPFGVWVPEGNGKMAAVPKFTCTEFEWYWVSVYRCLCVTLCCQLQDTYLLSFKCVCRSWLFYSINFCSVIFRIVRVTQSGETIL